jgi:hypothetical protein
MAEVGGHRELLATLQGLTQVQALHRIALAQGGTVRATYARDMLHGAGLSREKPATLTTHVHHMLDALPSFVRIERGVYRWTGTLLELECAAMPEAAVRADWMRLKAALVPRENPP